MVTSRVVHKWIGIIVGVSMLLWLITGIWMILPSGQLEVSEGPGLSWDSAMVSPAQAVAAVAAPGEAVRRIQIDPLLDRMVYRVFMNDWSARMVDAFSGEPLTVTPQMAEEIARARFGLAAQTGSVERLEKHDLRYSGGRLPVYRVSFDDSHRTVVYVTESDGLAQGGGRGHRVRSVVGRLHTFYPLRVLVSSKGEKGLVVLIGGLTVIGVITGYWLGLPGRWRRRLSGG